MSVNSLRDAWRDEVYDKSDFVDPNKEYTWEGVMVGWLIAKGLAPEDAREFAWKNSDLL